MPNTTTPVDRPDDGLVLLVVVDAFERVEDRLVVGVHRRRVAACLPSYTVQHCPGRPDAMSVVRRRVVSIMRQKDSSRVVGNVTWASPIETFREGNGRFKAARKLIGKFYTLK